MTDIDEVLAGIGLVAGDLDGAVLDRVTRHLEGQDVNPAHLPHGHPVRVLLDAAAAGSVPTRRQLDQLDSHDLPDGMSLGRFRSKVKAAADDIIAARAGGNNLLGRRVAADKTGELARQMTDEERAIATSDPNPEALTDIGRRMFGG